jgi:uncharacterized membrane protein YeaQ/YmgE (transglycosylase-associated protein family)
VIGFVFFLFVVGLVGGFIARAVVPGTDSMSFGATVLLGVIGSFVGGFLGYLFFRDKNSGGAFHASGIIGSIIGSIIALLVYRAANGRRLSR